VICNVCRSPLEEQIARFNGKWHGFTRCTYCVPSGKWEPRGVVEIVWAPLPIDPPKP
jgi:hypothetical protein